MDTDDHNHTSEPVVPNTHALRPMAPKGSNKKLIGKLFTVIAATTKPFGQP